MIYVYQIHTVSETTRVDSGVWPKHHSFRTILPKTSNLSLHLLQAPAQVRNQSGQAIFSFHIKYVTMSPNLGV